MATGLTFVRAIRRRRRPYRNERLWLAAPFGLGLPSYLRSLLGRAMVDAGYRCRAICPYQKPDSILAGHSLKRVEPASAHSPGAAALRTVLDMHPLLYRRCPYGHSHALAILGHLECLAGELAEARRYRRRALRMNLFSRKALIPLMLSFLGSRAHRPGATTGGSLVRAQMPDAVPNGGNR